MKISALLAGACAALFMATAAAEWPDRPVRIISPYAPAGSNDLSARVISNELTKRLGQPVNVENKPGAGTRIANEYVARAKPDGLTLLYAAAPFAIYAASGQPQRYDVQKDFTPIGPAVVTPVFLVVNAASPIKNVNDFVRAMRAKPEGATFVSPGIGSGPHLTIELVRSAGKLGGVVVHQRGDASAFGEVAAGRADATIAAISAAQPFIASGKLRVIAVASEKRSALYPDAATFGEQGMPGVIGYGWFGLLAPAGTPAPVIDRLSREMRAILGSPEIQKNLQTIGLQPGDETPEGFGTFIRNEVTRWREVITNAGITIE